MQKSPVFNRPLAVAPFAVARLALVTVLVPLVAGIVVHARAPVMAERIAPGLSLGAKLLLAVAATALLAGVWRSVWETTGQGAVVAITVFIVAGLAVGHLLGGPERETSLSWGCRAPAGIRRSPSPSPRRTSRISASKEPSCSTCS